jgi:hypothetical protein
MAEPFKPARYVDDRPNGPGYDQGALTRGDYAVLGFLADKVDPECLAHCRKILAGDPEANGAFDHLPPSLRADWRAKYYRSRPGAAEAFARRNPNAARIKV